MDNDTSTKIVPIVVTSIFVVVLSIGIFVFLNKEGNSLPNENQDIIFEDIQGENMSTIQDFENLEIKTLQEGSGEEAKEGDTVSVHYSGTLSDGNKFDSSYDRGTPFQFTLGQNSVIQGWEEGVKGMKVGEKRELRIPSSMGYGASGTGPIPGSAGLIFEVELLEIL